MNPIFRKKVAPIYLKISYFHIVIYKSSCTNISWMQFSLKAVHVSMLFVCLRFVSWRWEQFCIVFDLTTHRLLSLSDKHAGFDCWGEQIPHEQKESLMRSSLCYWSIFIIFSDERTIGYVARIRTINRCLNSRHCSRLRLPTFLGCLWLLALFGVTHYMWWQIGNAG